MRDCKTWPPTEWRTNFEKLRRERPDLASAFDEFMLRFLADRIEFANRQVASLSR